MGGLHELLARLGVERRERADEGDGQAEGLALEAEADARGDARALDVGACWPATRLSAEWKQAA